MVQGHHDVDVVLAMNSATVAATSGEVAVFDFQHKLRRTYNCIIAFNKLRQMTTIISDVDQIKAS